MALNPSVNYPTKTAPVDSEYPYGKARDITTPGDQTGTPWRAPIVNDLWGWMQEILSLAGITPSGNADKVGTSQYMDGIRRACGYPGLIVPTALNDTPANLGIRLLVLDGSGILVANYADLVSATYVGDANNAAAAARPGGCFYKAADAAGTSPSTSGSYFILPDARGQFIRGRDTAGAIDPDGASRYLGDLQTWATYNHEHHVKTSGDVYYAEQEVVAVVTGSADRVISKYGVSGSPKVKEMLEVGGVAMAATNVSTDEIRPTNLNFDWAIWY